MSTGNHSFIEQTVLLTAPPNLPSDRRFAYWDYTGESRELIHRGSGHRIALDPVLGGGVEMLRCILDVHNQPWGSAKVLDELVELLGTYFKGERVVR